MTLFNPFTSVQKESRQAPVKAQALNLFRFSEGIAHPTEKYDLYVDYYRTVLWVYACLKRFADRASMASWKLKQEEKSGEWTEIDRDHKAFKKLKYPNEDESFSDLIKGITTYQHLNGDAYLELAYKDVSSLSEADLMAIYNIRPDRIHIDPRKDGKGINQYIFQVKPHSKKTYFSPDHIVHFKFFSPWHDFHGQAVLEALNTTLTKEQYTDKYQENVVKSDAIPRGVLETDIDIDDTEAQRILDNWNNRFAGLDKSGSVAILPLGLKFKPLSMLPKDIEYIKLLADNKERIFAGFGMNPAVLGLMTDSMTRDNFRMQIRSFYFDTLKPYLDYVAERINRFVLERFWGDSPKLKLEFDVASLMIEDEEALSSRFQKEILVGIKNPNEARQALGNETYDGGNTFFILNNLAPLHAEDMDLLNVISQQLHAPMEFVQDSGKGSDLTRDTSREMKL